MPERDKNEMSVRDAGRKGGETTAERYGHGFYEEIGKKGGERGGPRVRELTQKGKKTEK
ncbi:MAG TPA: Em GEA1 (EM1) [Armatimonadota bacterium]|nr:Em GEA1 (EM1) [Armatimonadota bacterium]